MAQVQMKLVALIEKLKQLSARKVVRKNVLCIFCRTEGNHKNECTMLNNYMSVDAPSPFLAIPKIELCAIRISWGHAPPSFLMLQKYYITTHAPFWEFYKSIRHDVNNCHTLKLMKDNTTDSYRVQGTKETNDLIPMDIKGQHTLGFEDMEEDMEEVEEK